MLDHLRWPALWAGAAALTACAVPLEEPADVVMEAQHAVAVPARGGAATFDVATWNLEWFGSTSYGPTNEALQLQNVRDVVSGADLDLWAVEEVVSANHFNSLVAQLPGYSGLLSNNPIVTSGSSYYSSAEQKVGIIYKTGAVTVHGARLILTANATDFGGRPPLELDLTVSAGGSSRDLLLIVAHAKAGGDSTSYTRRKNAAAALKAYLDGTYPAREVLVAGDFNDDVDTSISSGKASPYASFVADPARYTFETKVLSDAGERSTVSYAQMIDHHLATNELDQLYLDGSAEVYRVDQYISGYDQTTSDHYPVLTRYVLGAGPAQVILNEILANEPASTTSAEFVEIVNAGGASADLAGWTLSDASGVRYTFAAGTTLAAGAALVVFGGASSIPPGLGNALAVPSGGLSLNNGGDTVTLADAGGAVIDSFTYDASLGSVDGVSMNRSPDGGAAGAFVLHTALAAASSSPGKQVNGASF